jgi:CMP-N,N'-diacetyllegionaminic acid synthase
METLAIIPARSGSKGIPGKNLIKLHGRPLIDYTISAAQSCKRINEIFISSDDDNILRYCADKGVRTKYKRPKHLATDNAGMVEVVIDALDWLSNNKKIEPEMVVLLQPTSPLRTSEDINKILSLLDTTKLQSAISVHKMTEHPLECITVQNNRWNNLLKQPKTPIQRQEYDNSYYFINGAIYAFTPSFLKKERLFAKPGIHTALYTMPSIRGVDIDTFDDLYQAEAYLARPNIE